MQSHFASPSSSVTSGTAIREGHAGQLGEVEAKLSRTLDGPAPRAAMPNKTLR
jgi:hypothetical protein